MGATDSKDQGRLARSRNTGCGVTWSAYVQPMVRSLSHVKFHSKHRYENEPNLQSAHWATKAGTPRCACCAVQSPTLHFGGRWTLTGGH